VTSELTRLYLLGERLDATLSTGDFAEIQVLMDTYLAGLYAQFHHQDAHTMPALDSEQRRLLQQFKALLERVEHEKNQTESELRGLSKAGRVAELYKQNAG